jgi:sterol desaturase/sphingolipid hydroxylase (fatty acid hydroxylase superfamily)
MVGMNAPSGRGAHKAHLSLETSEPLSFGSGFISGLLSAILGIAGFGAVLCMRFPEYLSYQPLQVVYSRGEFRAGVHIVLVASFVLGTASAFLRANKALALTGVGFTLVASLIGGSRLPLEPDADGRSWLGLDFFALNLIVYSAVFIPLERLFALRIGQAVFRRQWLVDLTYFFVNSLLIEILTILTLRPALILFGGVRVEALSALVGSQPVLLQVLALILVADFTQYWVHRTFHAVPFLWPFHAIHHSSEEMDWLAGSRLHLVDVIVTRGLTYMPIFVLGFSAQALAVYVLLVAAQATFIHANVRWEFRALRSVIATPVFHHWHHSSAREAVDKNFAVHTPIWDLLFGTFYDPDRWPAGYGLSSAQDVPARWTTQLLYPFGWRVGGRANDRPRRSGPTD